MKIWWVIIISLGLRLISLNQSLWLDEAISANVVKNYSYSQIIDNFSPNDFHPPGYYFVLKAWTTVFGNSVISLRLPSVIFSLITIYIVYLLAGPAVAGLTGLNPLLIYYSQEARMYSLITMLLTVALYCFIKKKYWLYSLVSCLSFMVFYGSIFLLIALAGYLLIKKEYKALMISSVGILTAMMILMPLLLKQFQNSRGMLYEVKNWSLVLGKVNLKNLLLIPMKFTSGRISFEPKWLYYAIAGGWVMYVFRVIVRNSFSQKFFGYVFWGSLLTGTMFSFFTPMLQYFRFLYLIPIMAIIIGKNKIIASGFLIFSLIYLLNPVYWREDWQSLSRRLGDKIYMIDSFGDPVKYYRPEIKVVDIRQISPNLPFEDLRTSLTKEGQEKTMTVIPYGEEIHGVDHNNILGTAGYKKIKETNFREIKSEIWQYTP